MSIEPDREFISPRALLHAIGLGAAALAFTACAAPRPTDLSATLKDAAEDVSAAPLAAPLPLQDDDRSGYGDASQLRSNSPWEVLLTGGGASNEDFDAGVFQASGQVGYFLTDELEVALRQGVTFNDAGAGASANYDAQTRVAVDYHFPLDQFWPFIGVNFGGLYGDTTNETLAAGPEAGFKWFLKEEAFLYAQIEWMFFFDTDDSLNSAFDEGALLYNLGFGLRF